MADDQIINGVILWMKEIHYPAPAPVGGMLQKTHKCDERRKWSLISKIEYYGFAKLYDRKSGSDMSLTAFGILAAENGDPMAYYMQSIQDKQKPTIQGENIFYNTGSVSGSSVSQSRDSLRPAERPIYQPIADDTHKPTMVGKFWEIISKNPLISTAIASVVAGIVVKVIERYMGFK